MKNLDESLATRQLQDRVFTVLTSHQLLLRYAIANGLVSPCLFLSCLVSIRHLVLSRFPVLIYLCAFISWTKPMVV